ncbi:MAG TPA: aldo/keto reductase [Bryobacteraceae bacterium]|nr:aldo/keto reductase [Bryobacteraceae bacterium]
MRYRRLGKTGFQVSEMGYGAWGIGGKLWLGGDDRESAQALRLAIERGVNFIDTALAYGDGHSEQLVGQVVREAGHKIYIASKVPPKNLLWPARPGVPISDVFPYEYIMESTESSLNNLGLDTIDVQQLHVWNPEWIACDEWKRAFEDLKRSGKAQAVGISINDHQPDSALEIVRTGLLDTVQVIYNIFDQTPEKNLFPLAMERDIGVIARTPLDEGALTGRINPHSQFEPTEFRARYFKGDRKKQVAERVAAIEHDLGLQNGVMPEVALRFCISHPSVSSVIPGMRTRANVEFNCTIPGKGPLPEKVLAILRKHAWEKNFYGA